MFYSLMTLETLGAHCTKLIVWADAQKDQKYAYQNYIICVIIQEVTKIKRMSGGQIVHVWSIFAPTSTWFLTLI